MNPLIKALQDTEIDRILAGFRNSLIELLDTSEAVELVPYAMKSEAEESVLKIGCDEGSVLLDWRPSLEYGPLLSRISGVSLA